LIEQSLDYELGGKATTKYREKGVVVTLKIPAVEHHIAGVAETPR
jgi:hypothetical protein